MTPFIGGSLVFLSLLFFCVSFAAKPFGGGVLLLLFRRLLLFCSCSCPCSCSCASRHSGSRSCLVVRFLFFLHRPLLLSIPRVHRPRSSNFLGFALPMLCCSYNFASGAVADEDISRRIRSHCYGYCGRRRCPSIFFLSTAVIVGGVVDIAAFLLLPWTTLLLLSLRSTLLRLLLLLLLLLPLLLLLLLPLGFLRFSFGCRFSSSPPLPPSGVLVLYKFVFIFLPPAFFFSSLLHFPSIPSSGPVHCAVRP